MSFKPHIHRRLFRLLLFQIVGTVFTIPWWFGVYKPNQERVAAYYKRVSLPPPPPCIATEYSTARVIHCLRCCDCIAA